MNYKKLSLGLIAAAMLATPAMAQQVAPGAMGYYTNSRYLTDGYGVRSAPEAGYYSPGYPSGYYPRSYHGNRFYPAPRVGAFATAPWDDGSYPSLGLVERQW